MAKTASRPGIPMPVIAIVSVLIVAVALLMMTGQKPEEVVVTEAAICGDSMCNGNETCSTCQADCGMCPIPPMPRIKMVVQEALPPPVCNMTEGEAYLKALEEGNPSYCNCVLDSEKASECRASAGSNANYVQAVNTYDLALCDTLTNPYAKESCTSIVTSAFDTILQQDPVFFINVYVGAQNFEDAIPLLENALQQNPNDYAALIILGKIYSEKAWTEGPNGTSIQKAIGYVDRAMQISPETSALYRLKGYLYESQLELDDALEALDKSIALDPENVLAYVTRGHVYRMVGDFENAFADLETAKGMDLNRAFLDIYVDLCTMESNIIELTDKAIDDCLIVINSNDTLAYRQKSEAQVVLGNLYRISGRYDEALNMFNDAISYEPTAPAAYSSMARLYNGMGNYTAAQESAEKAIAAEETKATAYSELAYALFNQGRVDEAIQTALTGLEMAERDRSLMALTKPVAKRGMYYLLADIYLWKGDSANKDKYVTLAEQETEKLNELIQTLGMAGVATT